MRIMLEDGFFAGVREQGEYLADRLTGVATRFPDLATGVRGSGLLLGLVLTEKGIGLGAEIVEQLFQEGVLINFAGNRVLRFIPPLIVGRAEIDALIDSLAGVLARLSS
jgi:acetylornithine/N-succinyldiaminopimelate aminotransferase